MAVEKPRKCGFRKIGGLYLVGGELSAPCDRMPYLLETCPCCGGGIKQARSWTWIMPSKLFGYHNTSESALNTCDCSVRCPMCYPDMIFGPEGKATLLWVGSKHYTVAEFLQEGAEQGVSKRINTIPRNFEIGSTWVFFAHPDAVSKRYGDLDPGWTLPEQDSIFGPDDIIEMPGIFCCFRPSRIDMIVKQSEYNVWWEVGAWIQCEDNPPVEEVFNPDAIEIYNRLQRDVNRRITLIPVPDDDPDHQ